MHARDADNFKVLVLTTSYPANEKDPSGIFIAKLLSAIRKRGHALKVVAPSNGLSYGRGMLEGVATVRFGYFYPRSMEKLTTGMGGIPESMAKSRLARIQLVPMMARFLSTGLLESRGADLIYANWLGAGLIGAALKVVTGKPLIVSFRGDDGYLARDRPLWRVLTTWVIKHCDAVAPVSRELRDIFVVLGTPEDKCYLPRFGVDVEMFRPAPKEPRDDVEIIYVGAVIRKKGVHDLLAALAQTTHPNARLVVVGGGPDEAELMLLSEQLGLKSRVDWRGVQPPDEVARLMRNADILCLPSYTEGRPNVITEAMASGLPVVATRVGGIPDMVKEPEVALLHTPGDVSELRNCLDTLIPNPGLRSEMGRNARDLVMRSGLNWDTTALDFENIFSQARAEKEKAAEIRGRVPGWLHYARQRILSEASMALSGSIIGRLGTILLNSVGFLAPGLISLILFVVFFNNVAQPELILAAIMAANLASVVFLSRPSRMFAGSPAVKLGAWCSVVVLGGLLAIEGLFPTYFPERYAELQNLAPGFLSAPEKNLFQVQLGPDTIPRETLPQSLSYVPAAAVATPVDRQELGVDFGPLGYGPYTGVGYVRAVHGTSRESYQLQQGVIGENRPSGAVGEVSVTWEPWRNSLPQPMLLEPLEIMTMRSLTPFQDVPPTFPTRQYMSAQPASAGTALGHGFGWYRPLGFVSPETYFGFSPELQAGAEARPASDRSSPLAR